MAQLYPPDDIRAYFLYSPNHAAAIFFIIWFGLLTIGLFYQSYKKKQWWLMSLALMAALESGGYIARELLYVSPNDNAFKAELVILILAPNLLALCCYILLGKIITYTFTTRSDGKTNNWLTRHPKFVPYFYLASDVLCIAIQGIGGGILSGATTTSQLNTGKSVEVTGLALQLAFISTFVFICAWVWIKMKQLPVGEKNTISLCDELLPSYIVLLCMVCLLVLRNIYRTMEFSTGGFVTGYFQQNEAWYLVFDPTLMSIALTITLLFNYTKRLPEDCLNPPIVKPSTLDTSNTEMVVPVKECTIVVQPEGNAE